MGISVPDNYRYRTHNIAFQKEINMAEDERKHIKKLEELYERALFSIESGQCDYAITLLKSALSIDPNFIKAQEGIRLAKTRKLQRSRLSAQKIKAIFFIIQAFFYEHFIDDSRFNKRHRDIRTGHCDCGDPSRGLCKTGYQNKKYNYRAGKSCVA